MNLVLLQDWETIKERLLTHYSIEDILNILALDASELADAFQDKIMEDIEDFPDITTELDYDEEENGNEMEEEA